MIWLGQNGTSCMMVRIGGDAEDTIRRRDFLGPGNESTNFGEEVTNRKVGIANLGDEMIHFRERLEMAVEGKTIC